MEGLTQRIDDQNQRQDHEVSADEIDLAIAQAQVEAANNLAELLFLLTDDELRQLANEEAQAA